MSLDTPTTPTPRARLSPREILERLNEPQREAVSHLTGPLLILAGAGSDAPETEVARVVEYMTVSGARARVERRLFELLEQARDALGLSGLSGRGRLALLGAVAAIGERKR